MFSERTSVGLDVHARSTTAWALDYESGEVFSERLVANTADVVAWVAALPQPAAVAYEAGPTGFVLARALDEIGVRCVVVAPSKIERPSGDRVKTDKRDARRLAKLLHLDELPAVRVPAVEQEAARDLTRARDDVRADLMRSRHRLSKLLLRQGIIYTDGKAWTAVHHHWLTGHHFEQLGLRVAYDEALETVLALEARRTRLDAAITELAGQPAWAPVVARLACMRGVSTLTAFGLAVEIGDWHRFTGSTIGAFLGLVPCEDSSGGQRRQGSITKTGNTHARRLLVEAAWHHRRPYRRPGVALRARLDQVPAPVRQRAEQGNRRLHQRWTNLDARRKRSTISAVAVARELSGWCWSLAIMED
jgi:transposase